MGCLSVTANLQKSCIHLEANRIGIGISAKANRVGGINVTCGLVCTTNKAYYLNVSPETIFLMPGNNFTDNVLVLSNIEWKVDV